MHKPTEPPFLAETIAKSATSPSLTTIFCPVNLLPSKEQDIFSSVGDVLDSLCAKQPIISPAASLGR